MRQSKQERIDAERRREAQEKRNRAECAAECTVESLIEAERAERAAGGLPGFSPWCMGPGKRGGYIFCAKHRLYVPIEWDEPVQESA